MLLALPLESITLLHEIAAIMASWPLVGTSPVHSGLQTAMKNGTANLKGADGTVLCLATWAFFGGHRVVGSLCARKE